MIRSPTLIGWRNCRPSTAAVTRRLRVWRWQAMAPAMSMRCMTVPPRMNPSGFASFGSTTCTISVADSSARFGSTGGAPALEIVANPDREAWPAELRAAALRCKPQAFPLAVEKRAPRPIEVDGESEREGFEPDPVRGAGVLQPQSADDPLSAVDRDREPGRGVDQQITVRIALVADDGRVPLGA